MRLFSGLVKPGSKLLNLHQPVRHEKFMIADKDIYRDAEGNIVDENDPKAAFLVAGKGTEIPTVIVEKYGLGKARKAETGEKTEQKKTEPAANKSFSPAKNKGRK